MALNLYLDDCANSDRLTDLLRRTGHRVVRPTDVSVGMGGEADDLHFRYAAENGLILLTKNSSDFELLAVSDSLHFGILAVYQDNDPSRDMSNADIVKAIANLEQAAQSGGDPIHGLFHKLNDWRY